jgi:GNAT superfamily N-acetyltransferase
VIRVATAQDAQAIARVQVRAWQHAYADIIDPETLDDLSVDDLAARWRDAAEGRVAWVDDHDDTIAGFASIRDAELRTLYVDPIAQGAGVGTALLREAVAAGAQIVRVFEANARARRFYERHGWVLDGPSEPLLGRPVVRYRLGAP